LRHLSNIKVLTATILQAAVLVLLMAEIQELRRCDGFVWHGMPITFHEDWYRRSSNIKACLSSVRGCNVGITDEKDL
jgi:hypothetical protein